MEWPMMSIFFTGVCARIDSILRWMRNADCRMSRVLSEPRLNEKTQMPSPLSRRSMMYIEPRVPRKPCSSSTGGEEGVAVVLVGARIVDFLVGGEREEGRLPIDRPGVLPVAVRDQDLARLQVPARHLGGGHVLVGVRGHLEELRARRHRAVAG